MFRIDVFTPNTLPMARLAEYMAALAKLLGHQENIHFVGVEKGSAQLVHNVDPVDVPKVESRLKSVAARAGDAPKDALAAHQLLEDLLANDNAIGSLNEAETGQVIVPFIGRDRAKPTVFPPFREDTVIQGQVVKIGGRDATAHATLQDGDVLHTNVSMSRDLAQELAKLLYGPIIRLHGNGKFERQIDGVWKMLDFKVDRYSLLLDKTVAETLAAIRQIPGNGLMTKDAYLKILEERDGSDNAK